MRSKESRNIAFAFTVIAVSFVLIAAATFIAQDDRQDPREGRNIEPTVLVKDNLDNGDEYSLRQVIASAKDGDIIAFDPTVDWLNNHIVLKGEIAFSQSNITIDGGGVVTI
ncbi:MAG: hypothetical protein LBH88_00275, partial [Candidatus Methanoplasma sp.]|nr:hypothetical protein [Candidatus Methanoplasma sp.]